MIATDFSDIWFLAVKTSKSACVNTNRNQEMSEDIETDGGAVGGCAGVGVRAIGDEGSEGVRARAAGGGGSVDSGVGSGGSEDNGVAIRGLTKRFSSSSLTGEVSDKGMSRQNKLLQSKIDYLIKSVNEKHDAFTHTILASKETVKNRAQMESAFRFCKEAFLEMATLLSNSLGERLADYKIEDIKTAIKDVMQKPTGGTNVVGKTQMEGHADEASSYASVVGKNKPKVHISGGPVLSVPKSTAFMIVPEKDHEMEYTTSQATREAVCKILKPSDCALKIKKVSNVRKNGIRIEAISPDINRIKMHQNLAKAGFKVVENLKMNPRLIVYGVPSEMTAEEIRKELVAQHFKENLEDKIKIVYLYQPKAGKRSTNCVIEVTPEVRRQIFKNGKIYLRYVACNFADHVRVLQCFRCMMFGHTAKNCKVDPVCGHCSEAHEMKECKNRQQLPVCCNCKRNTRLGQNDIAHSALDVKKCPFLENKIKDRITNINYE